MDAGRPEEPACEPTAGAPRQAIYFGYWLIAFAFVAQFVAVGVQNYAIGPFLTPMTEDLGWSRTEYTIPRTIASIAMAVVGYLIGAQVDRHGPRRFMLIGGAIVTVALYLHGEVTTLAQWIVLNGIVLTAGAAMVGNLVVNVMLARWFVELRGRAVALASMGVSFAGIVLTPAITLLIDEIGWRAAWRWLAVGSALLIAPVAAAMRRAPEDYGLLPDGRTAADVRAGLTERAKNDFALSLTRRDALRTPTFYLLIVAFGLFTITIPVMLLQTIPLMSDAGYPRSIGALMIAVASVPALVSKPLWGLLIDRLDGKPLAATSAVLTGVALIAIVVAVQARSEAGAYVGFFLLGLGWGGMIPIQEVIWASFFGRRYLGAVRSAAMPFSLLIGAMAPLLVSIYHDVVGNYDGALLAIAAANLASAGLMLLIPSPRRA